MKRVLFACLMFSSLAVITGCYKNDEYNDVPEIGNPTDHNGYYTVTFNNGTSNTWTDGESGVINNYSGVIGKYVMADSIHADTVTTFRANYSSVFSSPNTKEKLVFTTDTLVSMDTGTVYTAFNAVRDTVFINALNKGSYTYKTSTKNGVTVTFTDKTGKVWSSDKGAQASASYIFTPFKSGNLGTSAYVQGSISFTCKLYNGSSTMNMSGTATTFFVNSK